VKRTEEKRKGGTEVTWQKLRSMFHRKNLVRVVRVMRVPRIIRVDRIIRRFRRVAAQQLRGLVE
jgi:hypothetical protein